MSDELTTGITTLLGLDPVTAGAALVATGYVFEKLAGPSLANIGESLAAHLVVWREQRTERIRNVTIGAAQHVIDSGRSPQRVPGPILVPLLASAALEENEAMLDVWTRLLANAADPAFSERVLPSFVSILADLSPREAVLLNAVYTNETPGSSRIGLMVVDKSGKYPPFRIYAPTVDDAFRKRTVENELEYELQDFRIYGGSLARMGLCMAVPVGEAIKRSLSEPPSQFWLRLTPLGRAFVEACSRP